MEIEQGITLGLLGTPHLGDTLCTSVLPRQIYETYGVKPHVVRHETTEVVFENNPYVAGFSQNRVCPLHQHVCGQGHMIQRLQRGFSLRVSEMPEPEVYLSDEEIAWAKSEKNKWPTDKPICLVSLRAISDAPLYVDVDWLVWLEALQKHFTLIRPIITKPRPYYGRNYVFDSEIEKKISGGSEIFYEDLTVRRFFALFRVADCFSGLTSGASHVAAAFELPTLIFMRNDILEEMKKLTVVPPLTPASFLYPQHMLLPVFQDRVEAEKIVEKFYCEAVPS